MTEMPGSLIGPGSVIGAPSFTESGLTTALGGQKCFFHKLFNLKNCLDMDIFYLVKQMEINVLYQYYTAMKEIYLDFLPE